MEYRTELGTCCLIQIDKPLHDCPRFQGISVLKYSNVKNEFSSGLNLNRYGDQIDLVEFTCDNGFVSSICSEYSVSEHEEAKSDLLDAIGQLDISDYDLKKVLSKTDTILSTRKCPLRACVSAV